MSDDVSTALAKELPQKALRKFTLEPDVPVHCACDDFIPLDEFNERPDNPNVHPPVQIHLLGDIIAGWEDEEGKHEGTGWRNTVVVSRRSGLVTKGHGRIQAARYKGLRGAPVDYQDYASEEEEIADVMADNKIAELSHMSAAKSKPLLQRIQLTSPTILRLTGFKPLDLKKHLEPVVKQKPQYELIAEMNEKYDYVVVFADNATDDTALCTLLGIEVEQSYKKTGVGMGRVITFEKFLEQITKNVRMLPVPIKPPPH